MLTSKELADRIGISLRTFFRKVAKLKDQEKFSKEHEGYFYTSREAHKLQTLLTKGHSGKTAI